MGKVKPRLLGDENIEEKQKKEQKEKKFQKKARSQAAFAGASASQRKIRAQGLKGGQRMTEVEVKQSDLEKMEKAKKILESPSAPTKLGATVGQGKKKVKKISARLHGKNYKKALKAVDRNKKYSLNEAVKLLKKIKYTKFDESVELHLNVDKTGLKGEVELPHPTGKTFRVKIVDDKFIEDLEKGQAELGDILITHPSFMPRLTKFAKVLGPKGLMPNPKAGTISPKPEEVAKKFEKGTLRWRTEAKFPLVHQMIGKVSFAEKDLIANAEKFLEAVGKNHILKAFIKTTMSPSIKINLE